MFRMFRISFLGYESDDLSLIGEDIFCTIQLTRSVSFKLNDQIASKWTVLFETERSKKIQMDGPRN